MKSAPWQSSCRAVQDRRTAQANSRHVQRLMNVKPSIDMRKPKALKYKRSRKNKQTVADVSTQEDHKNRIQNNHCHNTQIPLPNAQQSKSHIKLYFVLHIKLFGFRFFLTASFETNHWSSYFFSISIHNHNPISQKARQQQIQRDNNRMLRNLLEVDPSRRAERKQRFSR